MDLLIPETGTVIWMFIAFIILFFALAKWGFPMITGMVDKRQDFIDKSLDAAKEANARLADIQTECQNLLTETRAERARILKEAAERSDEIIAQAKTSAQEEADRIIVQAKEKIRLEREEAVRGIRRQVAELSVDIAEQVLRSELENKDKQYDLVDRLIDSYE